MTKNNVFRYLLHAGALSVVACSACVVSGDLEEVCAKIAQMGGCDQDATYCAVESEGSFYKLNFVCGQHLGPADWLDDPVQKEDP
ncbi:MAG: hypothetical protein EOO38_11385 [Cytophagaceae bacterium]|nr:MAG: hypothetical protein EOO38_11385 [Cytophagaceae bacterium]